MNVGVIAELIGMLIGGVLAIWFISIPIELLLRRTHETEKGRVATSVTVAACVAVALWLLLGGNLPALLAYGVAGPMAYGIRVSFLPKRARKPEPEPDEPLELRRLDDANRPSKPEPEPDEALEYECTDCGAAVSERDEVCPKCGADVSVIDEDEPTR